MKNDSEHSLEEAEQMAAWFNEQEVHEWLRARAGLYQIPGLVLRITSDVVFSSLANVGMDYVCGNTFDEAVAKLRKVRPTPTSLREQAHLLMQQAEAMEAESNK